MPTYEYLCDNGHRFDRYLPLSEFDSPQTCECGEKSKRLISLPSLHISPDIHYQSPIDGRSITSMQARREDLARSNCIEYDPEMKTDQLRRVARQEADLERAVEETVDQEISKMPARQREKLEAELDGGMTAEPVRTTAPLKPIHTEIDHG